MKTNKGFSLVELIVVIAIMAIIAGVAIPVYTHYIDDADEKVEAVIKSEIEHAFSIECSLERIDEPTSIEVNDGAVSVQFNDTIDAGTLEKVVETVNGVIGNYLASPGLVADAGVPGLYTGNLAE